MILNLKKNLVNGKFSLIKPTQEQIRVWVETMQDKGSSNENIHVILGFLLLSLTYQS